MIPMKANRSSRGYHVQMRKVVQFDAENYPKPATVVKRGAQASFFEQWRNRNHGGAMVGGTHVVRDRERTCRAAELWVKLRTN